MKVFFTISPSSSPTSATSSTSSSFFFFPLPPELDFFVESKPTRTLEAEGTDAGLRDPLEFAYFVEYDVNSETKKVLREDILLPSAQLRRPLSILLPKGDLYYFYKGRRGTETRQ